MSKMIERILTSRLGIRILAEHHIALRNERACTSQKLFFKAHSQKVYSFMVKFFSHHKVGISKPFR